MSQAIEALYDGTAFRPDQPPSIQPNTRVRLIVLESGEVDLGTLGIGEEEAAELRFKFATFHGWNDPEMDAYDDYDNAKSKL